MFIDRESEISAPVSVSRWIIAPDLKCGAKIVHSILVLIHSNLLFYYVCCKLPQLLLSRIKSE